MNPVVDQGKLVGSVGLAEVSQLDRRGWAAHTLREVMQACRPDEVAAPEMDALEALSRFQRVGGGPLMVVDQGRLVGVLALRDLTAFLALRLQLEGARLDPLRAGPELGRRA